jgi:hypothetical protein
MATCACVSCVLPRRGGVGSFFPGPEGKELLFPPPESSRHHPGIACPVHGDRGGNYLGQIFSLKTGETV